MKTNKGIDSKQLADDLRDAYKMVSPFIEKHTAIVCPDCESVCCKDKHGRYDDNDLIYLGALEVDIPVDMPGLKDAGPCRNMTGIGCSLDRWMRPYRCTFFFCNALLKSIEEDDSKLYRAFMVFFEHMVSSRRILLG
ncbi:MAG: hypothetical protein ISR97_03040 [Nitrospira sp.]|nr:hypothetical protein [Nitrospira sp.]